MFRQIELRRDGFTSVTLDYIRFIAALAVVFGHWVSRYYGPFSEVTDPTLAEKIFRVLFSGYGSPAVMVFFVLSGLFIGQSVLKQINSGHFNLPNYLQRRLVRLWIVLIPALIITYAVDSLGLHYLGEDGIYQAGKVFGSIETEALSISVFLSNLFFLQTILTPPLGSNGALWSLANEFWYYVMFPLLALPFFTKSKRSVKAFQIALCMLLLYFVGFEISALFIVWLLGVAILFINLERIRFNKNILFYGSLILFLSMLVFIRLSPELESKFFERFVVAVGFVVFCIAIILFGRGQQSSIANQKLSAELAGFSYTLYLLHTPLLNFSRGLIINREGYMQFNASSLIFFFLALIATLIISYGVAKLTEFHTHKFYKFLKI